MSDLSLDVNFEGSGIEVDAEFGYSNTRYVSPSEYTGELTVVPDHERHILETTGKMLNGNVTIEAAPTSEVIFTENGEYLPPEGEVGFRKVEVEVNPDLRPLSVSENGTYEPDGFDGYSRVTVDVPQQFTLDNLVNSAALKNLGEITVNVSDIGNTAFHGWTFDTIHLPNVENFPNYYPFENTGIKYVDMPNVRRLGSTFYQCWYLWGTYGDGEGVLKLKKVTQVGNQCFYSCSRLKKVYFYKTATIAINAFRGCSGITDIYVPWSEGEVANAPWEATNATIHYDTVYDEDGNVVSST